MQLIRHRVNTLAGLDELKGTHWGAEIDLRSDINHPGKLILTHDPWTTGEDFDRWLEKYAALGPRDPLILNTKEDGLEQVILDRLATHSISHFFFLDTALPTLIRWTMKKNEKRFALRLSHYEPVESLLAFRGKAEWVWVDCFDGVPLDKSVISRVKADFKICLVSPELQGVPIQTIDRFNEIRPYADAVCSKSPGSWDRK